MKQPTREPKNKRRQWFCLPILSAVSGLLILVIMTALLLVLALWETARSLPLLLIVLGVVILGLSRQCMQVWKDFCALDHKRTVWNRQSLYQMLALTVGALAAYLLSVEAGLGAVVAAALVGIAGALLAGKTADSIYCGAFVGMVSQELARGYDYLAVAAIIAGLVYVISVCSFDGFGGKLGTIAFAGSVAAAVILNRPFIGEPLPAGHETWLILLFSILGAVLTFVIAYRLKGGAVMASGLVGLIAGLSLPLLFGENGQDLAVVAFCASFAGMSRQDRLSHEALVAAAGLVAGLIYILSAPYLGGMGGKLGTIAFGSTLAVSGLARFRKNNQSL